MAKLTKAEARKQREAAASAGGGGGAATDEALVALTHEGNLKPPARLIYPWGKFESYHGQDDLLDPPCGLTNCGNSCFGAAALNCLAYTRPMAAYCRRTAEEAMGAPDHNEKTCQETGWCVPPSMLTSCVTSILCSQRQPQLSLSRSQFKRTQTRVCPQSRVLSLPLSKQRTPTPTNTRSHSSCSHPSCTTRLHSQKLDGKRDTILCWEGSAPCATARACICCIRVSGCGAAPRLLTAPHCPLKGHAAGRGGGIQVLPVPGAEARAQGTGRQAAVRPRGHRVQSAFAGQELLFRR